MLGGEALFDLHQDVEVEGGWQRRELASQVEYEVGGAGHLKRYWIGLQVSCSAVEEVAPLQCRVPSTIGPGEVGLWLMGEGDGQRMGRVPNFVVVAGQT